MKLSLLSVADVQNALSQKIRSLRKSQKLSRDALAERSTVPSSTIKKFETTGQISLRQFLLLWQSVDDLERIMSMVELSASKPVTMEEVFNNG